MTDLLRPRLHTKLCHGSYKNRIQHLVFDADCYLSLHFVWHFPVGDKTQQNDLRPCDSATLGWSHRIVSPYARPNQHSATAVPAVQPVLRGSSNPNLNGGLQCFGKERQGAFLASQDWNGHDCGCIEIPHLSGLFLPLGQSRRTEGTWWRE